MTLPKTSWKPCHLDVPHRKYNNPRIYDGYVTLRDYDGKLRQIAVKGMGLEQPTLLITNNLQANASKLLTR